MKHYPVYWHLQIIFFNVLYNLLDLVITIEEKRNTDSIVFPSLEIA